MQFVIFMVQFWVIALSGGVLMYFILREGEMGIK